MANEPSLPGRTAPDPPARTRLVALDVLRGVAMCGILVSNIRLIAGTAAATVEPPMGAAHVWLGLPVLSLLFGIGFSLLLESARDRAPRPRLVLLRRLLALLVIGLLHRLLWPGDILSVYAVVGLLVLLPSSWLPRWAVAGAAAALVPTGLLLGMGGPLLVAGLFLTGSALVRYGVVARIDHSTRGPVLVGLACAAGAVLAGWAAPAAAGPGPVAWQILTADLLRTATYVCVLLVLLRTPLRPVLAAVFAPLGRIALTQHLSATLLVLGAAHLLGLPIADSLPVALAVAGTLLAAQWVFAVLWLRRFPQGPVEWLWRLATWGRRGTVAAPGAVPAG
ncbi:DUF418 domain-containing protein [Nocardiopsis sp. NPDC057823]|uniref:DUF418 domain-containing protein n=1 Tax=Nocardiopsis sp. NPDC057823 TaxID=3346256 RepID=UPI00366B2E7C